MSNFNSSPKKENIKRYIKQTSIWEIIVLVLSVLVDAGCFLLALYFFGTPMEFAIPLGLLFAAILNVSAFYGSFLGLGKLNVIPLKLRKIKNIGEDLKNAVLILIIASIIVIGFQGFFFGIRYDQIRAEDKKLQEYVDFINSEEFKSRTIEEQNAWTRNRHNRPRYYTAFNKQLDLLTLIMPIVTTLISIMIGLRKKQKYDYYTLKTEELEASIKAEEDLYKDKINDLKRDLQEKIRQSDKDIVMLDDSISVLGASINAMTGKISNFAGEINNVKDRIVNREQDKKHMDMYQELKTEVNEQLTKEAPKLYKKDIETLVASLDDKANKIHKQLKEGSEDQTIFSEKTLDIYKMMYKDHIRGQKDLSSLEIVVRSIAEKYFELADQNPDGTYDIKTARGIFKNVEILAEGKKK